MLNRRAIFYDPFGIFGLKVRCWISGFVPDFWNRGIEHCAKGC